MSAVVRRLGVFVLLVAMVAGWWFIGWWAIPAAGFLYGLLRRVPTAPREAMIAALIATLALTARWAMLPAFSRLLDQLGAIFPVPGIAVLITGVAIASLLAYTSARLAIGIAGTTNR